MELNFMSVLFTTIGTSHAVQRAGSEASIPWDIFWTALMRSPEGSPDLRESSSAVLNSEFEIMREKSSRARGGGKIQEWKFMVKNGKKF